VKHIKAAIVYKAEIPTDTTILHNHLAEKEFQPPMPMELVSRGFVPVDETEHGCLLAVAFPGGLAFRLRIDEKILPASVVNAEVAKAIEIIRHNEGRKPGKKERYEIKDAVLAALAQRALVRTTASITCYYHTESGYLIIPTTSKKIADACTSMLIRAVGSVKTETIHVSDVKHGLTTRLKQYLDDEDCGAFGSFQPCDEAALADTMKRKISVKMNYLHMAREGLTVALTQGFNVTSMGFYWNGVDFRLTEEFRLRGIEHPSDPGAEDVTWASEAAIQTKAVADIVNELVELLSYKTPEAEAA